MQTNTNATRKPWTPKFTLADRFLAGGGQRLRAGETATATTLRLRYDAKWAQAKGGAR